MVTGFQLEAAATDGEVLICPNVGVPCDDDQDCGAPFNPDCFCNNAINECRSRFLIENQ